MLSSLLVLAFARGDEVCEHTSVCSLGAAKNVSNSTGMCIHDPFYPGTKVCEICDGCPWPACPCCNPLYNEAGACSLCQVQSSYFRERCGNPTFAVKCDHSSEADPCIPVPGTVTSCNETGFACYSTEAQCSANCIGTFNCINDEDCVPAANGTVGKYSSIAACKAACGRAPPSPAPKPHYGDPRSGCLPDEANTTLAPLVSGDVCAAACTDTKPCPLDKPASVSAEPSCTLIPGTGWRCLLKCTPSSAAEFECGDPAVIDKYATCKDLEPTAPIHAGVCTYGGS